MSLLIYLNALTSSAEAWEDTSETVRGARKSLTDIDAGLLGPRVATAAQEFIDTWLIEIKGIQTLATDHGEALRDAARFYDQADTDAVGRCQQLMVWSDRTTSPDGPQQ